uniref:Serum amyloid A protein n=1 Tax=Sparus aurata TaxID=8175 RepID=A0A671VGI2_SPAAU
MKLLFAEIVLFLIVEKNVYNYNVIYPGLWRIAFFCNMWRVYTDMRKADVRYSDKYKYDTGNYDATQRRAGGRWAQVMWIAAGDSDKEDSSADQEANKWRCNSGDLNCYRPPGLP